MDLLEVGKIINTHGLRGEVKAVVWMDFAEDFEELSHVYVTRREKIEKLGISGVRYQKNNIIVKFDGIDDIDEAQKYKNCIMKAERGELGELPEGVHYIVDLIGLSVVTESGDEVGVISDVFNTGANDIYEVRREGKKNLLLPVIDDVVKEIDMDGGKVVVNILEGLDDEI